MQRVIKVFILLVLTFVFFHNKAMSQSYEYFLADETPYHWKQIVGNLDFQNTELHSSDWLQIGNGRPEAIHQPAE